MKIKVGGPSITPETVVVGGGADIGLDWLPNLFATREKGGKIVSVAQVFARTGMTEITWKSSGINSIAKMKGKKVGVWCCGNQPELYAALTKNGIDPNNTKDVTIFNQPFDMVAFLQRQDRRRGGDDLQRARAGPRDEEPEDRQALPAHRPERLQDGGRRHRDARGQHLHHEQVAEELREPGHAREVPAGLVQGLDLLPRPSGRLRRHRAQERADARQGPSDLADERDQQADLAERERHRRRSGVRCQRNGDDRQDLRRDQEDAGGELGQLHVGEQGSCESERRRASTSTGKGWKASTVAVTEGGK